MTETSREELIQDQIEMEVEAYKGIMRTNLEKNNDHFGKDVFDNEFCLQRYKFWPSHAAQLLLLNLCAQMLLGTTLTAMENSVSIVLQLSSTVRYGAAFDAPARAAAAQPAADAGRQSGRGHPHAGGAARRAALSAPHRAPAHRSDEHRSRPERRQQQQQPLSARAQASHAARAASGTVGRRPSLSSRRQRAGRRLAPTPTREWQWLVHAVATTMAEAAPELGAEKLRLHLVAANLLI